ncbi:AI-2E family transporter [Arthrobacter flavus]|uniref:AI-2E family transporter n=1 Tax=Arthrobacter flavus TaxID=95172 RepID=A0ABW4Q5L4_9MICC
MRSLGILGSGPFRLGFVTTLGVLLALVLGAAIASLGYALTLIFIALFVSLGLYPLILRLESTGLSRTAAVLVVMAGFLIAVVLLLRLLVPVIRDQAAELIRQVPGGLANVSNQVWFSDLNNAFDGALSPLLDALQRSATDPAVWLAISGGALNVGFTLVNGTFGLIFVVALTLYFVASLEAMKQSLYVLVPASQRERFVEIAEQIAQSVGKYLSGMFLLAVMNAAFTFILLTLCGVPHAGILAAFALPITLIPLVGSVINTIIVSIVSLFTSPGAALIVLIVMVIYLQIEAYVLTPRIVGKAISIPGSLVLIGALFGGTLLGLLGALVACPVMASILLIIKKVVVPAQEAK